MPRGALGLRGVASQVLAAQQMAKPKPEPAPVPVYVQRWAKLAEGINRGKAWHQFWNKKIQEVSSDDAADKLKQTLAAMRKEDLAKEAMRSNYAEWVRTRARSHSIGRRCCCCSHPDRRLRRSLASAGVVRLSSRQVSAPPSHHDRRPSGV